MKKVLLSAVVVLFATSAMAQPAKKEVKEDLKVGNNSFELLFTPFRSDGTMFNLSDFGIRYRHFFGANALRVSVGASFNANRSGDKTIAATSDNLGWVGTKDGYETTHNNSFKIALGYERHFNINRRLGIYVGGELGYQGTFASKTVWQDDSYVQGTTNATSIKVTKDYTETSPTSNSLIVAAITGIDFHVYKGLYLGAELGLKYKYTGQSGASVVKEGTASEYSSTGSFYQTTTYTYSANKTNKTTNTNGTIKSEDSYTGEISSHNSSHEFGFYAEPALRIGWRF